jgi:hypothetical protein
MRLLLVFARAYPLRSAIALFALLVAGLAEGLGLTTLLPLFTTALDGRDGAGPEQLSIAGSGTDEVVTTVLARVGLSPTLGVLVSIVVGGLLVKAALMLWAHRQVGYTVAQVATDLRLALIRALLEQPLGVLSAPADRIPGQQRRHRSDPCLPSVHVRGDHGGDADPGPGVHHGRAAGFVAGHLDRHRRRQHRFPARSTAWCARPGRAGARPRCCVRCWAI